MNWFSWHEPDDFDDDELTEFERAQVLAMHEVVREYEAKNRAYHDLLYWLATRIVPGEVDRRQTRDPFAFADLGAAEWKRFFQTALKGVHLSQSLAPITPDVRRLEGENRRLRQQLAVLEAQYNELKAERDRLQNTIDQQKKDAETSKTQESQASKRPNDGGSITIPKAYQALFSKGQEKRFREICVLKLLAKGYSAEASIRFELTKHIDKLSNPDSGSIRRLILRLEDKKLVRRMPISTGKSRIIILQLAELGTIVVQKMGIKLVESEWERLMRLHGGERQQKHAAQVCLFTHYARKRGWRTQVCPEVQPPADPDVLIEKDGERIYVEVEAGSGSVERRMKKWRNQRNLQGFVALCAPSESTRRMLVREARSNTKRGMATDFLWLREQENGLWAETW